MIKKFSDAFAGLSCALQHKAVLLQVVLGIVTIIVGFIIRLDFYEWLVFIVCITLVVSLEIVNTAIERIGDYLNLEYDRRIMVIKNLSSCAVLVASIGSFVIALLVILRRIL